MKVDGTAQGPHVSCSYSDIAMYKYDYKALSRNPSTSCWKRFRDDVFVIWNYSKTDLDEFVSYMNSIDSTGKMKCRLLII